MLREMSNCLICVNMKLVVLCLLVMNFYFVRSQNNFSDSVKYENPEVKWIDQWPSSDSRQKANNVPNKIKNFIFGKKITELVKPFSIIVDKQNYLWILDQGINSVFKINNNEGEIPHFIEKKEIGFVSLVGITAFSDNRILFTDSYLKKIFVINPDKSDLKILNDSLILSQPTGIAYSKVNNEIWVLETCEHRVAVLNERGILKRRFGTRGNADSEFNFPTHICIDNIGNVYIIDSMNFRVQVFDKDGKLISVFGSNGDATGFFARPKGIAVDSDGHIYIADALFHAVQVFDIKGNFLNKFGEQGQNQGQFWMPSGIFIDEKNKIYIADSYNSRIQVFQLINDHKK